MRRSVIRTEIDDDEIQDVLYDQQEHVKTCEEMDNHEDTILTYIDEIRPKFKNNGLSVSKIKKLYYANIPYPFFVVNLKDKFCPFVER